MAFPKLLKYHYPSKEQLEAMTPDQKRLLLLQLKQEDTMEWQKLAAQIQVAAFVIGLIAAVGWIVLTFLKM